MFCTMVVESNISEQTMYFNISLSSTGKGNKSNTAKEARLFFKQHLTAKIVVIVDTHTLELEYISGGPNTPDHHHKSLIVNLGCGALIQQDESHHSLLR